MAFNPMNDFNAAYQTATNVELARRDANMKAAQTLSNIEAQKKANAYTDAQTEKLMTEVKQLKRAYSIQNMNEGYYSYRNYGNPAGLQSLMDNDPDFKTRMNNMNIQKILNAKDYLTPENKLSIKRQMAVTDGLDPNAKGVLDSIPDERIGVVVTMDGDVVFQDLDTWRPFIENQQVYEQGKNAELAKMRAEFAKMQAETEKLILGNQKQQQENYANQQIIQAGQAGDTNALNTATQVRLGIEGKTPGKDGSKTYSPKQQIENTAALKRQEQYNANMQSGNIVKANYALYDGDAKQTLNASVTDLTNYVNSGLPQDKQISNLNNLSTKQLFTLYSTDDIFKNNVDEGVQLLDAKDKEELNKVESLASMLQGATNISPGDIGFWDSMLLKYAKGFEDFFQLKDNSAALTYASYADLGLKSFNRPQGYTHKQELDVLNSIQLSSAGSYTNAMETLAAASDKLASDLEIKAKGNAMLMAKMSPVILGVKQTARIARANKQLYKIDSDLPSKVAGIRFGKNGQAKYIIPPEGASPNNDYSSLPDNSEHVYWLHIGQDGKTTLVNSQGRLYGQKAKADKPLKQDKNVAIPGTPDYNKQVHYLSPAMLEAIAKDKGGK